MIRFLLALCMLAPSLALAHPNCAAHRGDGESTPFALKIDMPAKVVYQGTYDEQTTNFYIAEPLDTYADNTPNGRIGIRLPFTASANECLGYFKLTVEYDGTLWTCYGYELGEPWSDPDIEPYTYTTFNPDAAVTNYCSVTDDGTHDPKSAIIFPLYYLQEECVMEPEEETIIFYLLFEANQEWPRTWSGWDKACRFSVMCTSFAQPGLVPIDIAMHPHSNFNTQCTLGWGTGIDLWDAETCVIWDKFDESEGSPPGNTFCDEEDVGDECISCPGCNYNEECNSSLPFIMCNKTPASCLHLCESGTCKTGVLVTPGTWSVVKGLYR